MSNTEPLVNRLNDKLNREYVAIGKKRVRSWEAWMIIGIIVGISIGVIFIASNADAALIVN